MAGLIVLTLALVGGSVLAAKPADDTRPGAGWGDTKHDHTGPPGNSTIPTPPVL